MMCAGNLMLEAVDLVRAYCHLCVVTCDRCELYEFCLQVENPGIFSLSFV